MTKIEKALLEREMPYLPPFFYNNELALRCELSLGTKRSALKRARQIFTLLFGSAPDAIVFNYRLFDFSESGGPEEKAFDRPGEAASVHALYVREAERTARFLLENQLKYRHAVVRNTPSVMNEEEGLVLNNRVICYSDGRGFENEKLIKLCIDDRFDPELGFVSFANECVLVIYDDRGCDIVFASPEKYLEFHEKLGPYLLAHDSELMAERAEKAKQSM